MKFLAFSGRTAKEILRDPLNLTFGVGFPIALLLLLSAIQANIPVSLFEIESLTPGITVFGLSFMTLFSATLIAKDRESALLQRLYTTPLTAVLQSILCYAVAIMIGLPVKVTILYAVVFIIPVSLFFIAMGLLCGSVFNVKQAGGICGAFFTNIAAWLSGTWFDLNLVGGAFKKIAYALPFVHAVELERAVLNAEYADVFPHLLWVLGYAAAAIVIAVLLFLRQMKRQ